LLGIFRHNFLGLNHYKYRKGTDHIIAISKGVNNQLLRDGMPADMLSVVYSGVDVDRFRESSGEGLREQFGIPSGAPVHRLVLVEVYTPGGNWSSYPPHKHDVHLEDEEGHLLEGDLEEVYFYKIDKPEGYALQRVYTDETSPLHKAGHPIDALVRAENNCAVLVPEGYHPVVSAPGCTTYYLNVLAGSAQTLANQDDPRYTWVKNTYKQKDDRLPLY